MSNIKVPKRVYTPSERLKQALYQELRKLIVAPKQMKKEILPCILELRGSDNNTSRESQCLKEIITVGKVNKTRYLHLNDRFSLKYVDPSSIIKEIPTIIRSKHYSSKLSELYRLEKISSDHDAKSRTMVIVSKPDNREYRTWSFFSIAEREDKYETKAYYQILTMIMNHQIIDEQNLTLNYLLKTSYLQSIDENVIQLGLRADPNGGTIYVRKQNEYVDKIYHNMYYGLLKSLIEKGKLKKLQTEQVNILFPYFKPIEPIKFNWIENITIKPIIITNQKVYEQKHLTSTKAFKNKISSIWTKVSGFFNFFTRSTGIIL